MLRNTVSIAIFVLLHPFLVSGDVCHSSCKCTNLTDVVCIDVYAFSTILLPSYTKKLTVTKSMMGPTFNHSLSSLVELEYVDLSFNKVLNFPNTTFKFLRNLRVLKLNNNFVSKLEEYLFQFNNRIEYLDLSYNNFIQFPDVSFRFLENLKVLNLSHNYLLVPTLGPRFQVLTKLEMLDLAWNRFNIIPSDSFEMTDTWQSDIPRHLNLSYCGIHRIYPNSFAPFRGLQSISFAGNTALSSDMLAIGLNSSAFQLLKEIDISNMDIDNVTSILSALQNTPLKSLRMNNNRLANIPNILADYQRQLKSLEVRNNSLSALGYSVTDIVGLEFLDLSHNLIDSVDPRLGSRLVNLVSLDLAHNKIADDMINVQNMTKLKHLDLSNNRLTSMELPRTLSQVNYLSLAGNQISEIRSMIGFVALQHLDYSDNKIEVVSDFLFPESPHIYYLNLSGNSLMSVGHQAFHTNSPKIVDLSRNNLQRLHYLGWSNVHVIYLQYNKISVVERQTFYALYELQKLDLSYNQIAEIDASAFSHLLNVTHLHLNNNQFHDSESLSHFFSSMANLRYLDLSRNNISEIISDTFQNNKNLKFLYLMGNHIMTIQPSVFEGLSKLKSIDLSNNLFICDCELVEFRDWLRKSTIILQRQNATYKCFGPQGRISTLLVNYETEKYECNQDFLYTIIFTSIGGLVMIIGLIAVFVFKGYVKWRRNYKKSRKTHMEGYEVVSIQKPIEKVTKTTVSDKWREPYNNNQSYTPFPFHRETIDYEVEKLMNKPRSRHPSVTNAVPAAGLELSGVVGRKKVSKTLVDREKKESKKLRKKTNEKSKRVKNLSEEEIRFLRKHHDFAKKYLGQAVRPMPVFERESPLINHVIPYYYTQDGIRYATYRRPRQLPVPKEFDRRYHGDIIRNSNPERRYEEVRNFPPRHMYRTADIPAYVTLPRRRYPVEPLVQVHKYPADGSGRHINALKGPVRQHSADDLELQREYLRQKSVDDVRNMEHYQNLRQSKSENCLQEKTGSKYETIDGRTRKENDNDVLTKWI